MAASIIAGVLGLGVEAIKRLFPDPEQQAEQMYKLEKLNQEGRLEELQHEVNLLLAQIKVNEADAKSGNWFQAGWRPMVGWIGAMSLGYVAIVEPVARFVAKVFLDYEGEFPVIDTFLVFQIIGGMLGVSISRTAEKMKGVTK